MAPANPEANAQLARLLYGQRRELDAAAEHVEVALSYQRWSADLNLLAGQIYLQLEERGIARDHLERALSWSESERIRLLAAAALEQLASRSPVADQPAPVESGT